MKFVMVARDTQGDYIDIPMAESTARYIVEIYWGASLRDNVDKWKLNTTEIWRLEAWEQEKLKICPRSYCA